MSWRDDVSCGLFQLVGIDQQLVRCCCGSFAEPRKSFVSLFTLSRFEIGDRSLANLEITARNVSFQINVWRINLLVQQQPDAGLETNKWRQIRRFATS